jgi:hypothetical protein
MAARVQGAPNMRRPPENADSTNSGHVHAVSGACVRLVIHSKQTSEVAEGRVRPERGHSLHRDVARESRQKS